MNITDKEIAIVVGHEPGGGAEGEREFNVIVADKLWVSLTNMGARPHVYMHSARAYGRRMREMTAAIKSTQPDCFAACELHYDDVDIPSAHGHHFQYLGFLALADAFRDEFQEAFPWSRGRQDDGVYHNASGNGSGFLRAAPCPAVLCEPFFHSNPREMDYFKDRHDEIARVYALGFAKFAEMI